MGVTHREALLNLDDVERGVLVGVLIVGHDVARAHGAAREGEAPEVTAASLLRRISISIHRENARAILRRMPSGASTPPAPAPEAWGEDELMNWQ